MRDLPRFDIDPDIGKAWTPPGWVYTDAGVFARQRESIFAKSWQLVGDAGRLTAPGSVEPCTFLAGLLPEPLVLARDEKDGSHCFSNVCTHRGTSSSSARASSRACAAATTAGASGSTAASAPCPSSRASRTSRRRRTTCRASRSGAGRRFLFASLDPAAPFDATGPRRCAQRMRLAAAPTPRVRRPRARATTLVQANWALYCDNYLEGFHIPFVHAGLARGRRLRRVPYELLRASELQLGVAARARTRSTARGPPDHGSRIAAYYCWLFPNTMLNFYPWGFSVNVVHPLGRGPHAGRRSSPTVGDPGRLEPRRRRGLDRVEREDEAIVEAVQRGLALAPLRARPLLARSASRACTTSTACSPPPWVRRPRGDPKPAPRPIELDFGRRLR